MLGDNEGMRERAHVLWDSERLKRCHILELFKNAPAYSGFVLTREALDRMFESIEERSHLQLTGGIGYLSNGDESGVV